MSGALAPDSAAGSSGARLRRVRIVLCDDDPLMRDLVETIVVRAGHEVVGIADTTIGAIGLVQTARPDAVLVDPAIDVGNDYDTIAAAQELGIRVLVFSHTADADVLSRYATLPTVVAKPDLTALEQVLARLDRGGDAGGAGVVDRERRRNPGRGAAGPKPMGISDAQAFFEALNQAVAGDALVSIDAPGGADALATALLRSMRASDRLLAFPAAVRLYLPECDQAGLDAFFGRLADVHVLPAGAAVAAVVVAEGELGADAFDRLKRTGGEPRLPLAGA
jgi:CheY-like chemotaxis protein